MNRGVAASDADRRVGFFIAGVQKGGTSSLYSYCVEHPAIVGSAVKETHFFDNEDEDWAAPGYSKLHALFNGARRGLRCDGTPIYVYWPPSIGRINEYNGEALFVVVFRDPIERAWSQWRMNFANREESLPFADAIRGGRSRLPPTNELAPAWRVFGYVERGLYGAQVRRLLSVIGQERVLFLRSEDLKNDPSAVLSRVAEFLNVSPFRSIRRKSYNEAPTAPSRYRMTLDDVRYLQQLFRPDLSAFASLTGVDVSEWLTMSDEPILPTDTLGHRMRGAARRARSGDLLRR